MSAFESFQSEGAGMEFDWAGATRLLANASTGADDADLFIEETRSERLLWDDGRLKDAAYGAHRGFGLRIVAGEAVGYGHADSFDPQAIARAANVAERAKRGYSGTLDVSPARANFRLYEDIDPVDEPAFSAKADIMAEIDAYCRARDGRVVQVSVSFAAERRLIAILRPTGERFDDARPLVRIGISVTVEQGGRRESASVAAGGRTAYDEFIAPERWKPVADEALRGAVLSLAARPAPSGELEVVLGPGWPGVMVHEAVGHGLEGDFNRKGNSVYTGRIGERVAAPGVTIVDHGRLDARRGSLNFDDEGTPTRRNVLVEDGILKGYMQDRQNARLMRAEPTGNGRRESYRHQPQPRMTNTYMEAGSCDPGEILNALKRGVYITNLGGGQVDITNGKFVFRCTEAYWVENGRIQYPVKGATIIGDGPRAMQGIRMVGDDLELDAGVGTCGKNGQSIPTCVGQPTMLISGLTVGGG